MSKHEIRNPKQYQNPNNQSDTAFLCLNFYNSNLFRVSISGFGIWEWGGLLEGIEGCYYLVLIIETPQLYLLDNPSAVDEVRTRDPGNLVL
jgi:hypothetical protein